MCWDGIIFFHGWTCLLAHASFWKRHFWGHFWKSFDLKINDFVYFFSVFTFSNSWISCSEEISGFLFSNVKYTPVNLAFYFSCFLWWFNKIIKYFDFYCIFYIISGIIFSFVFLNLALYFSCKIFLKFFNKVLGFQKYGEKQRLNFEKLLWKQKYVEVFFSKSFN